MNALRKFLTMVFGVLIAVACQIGAMIYGWGVHPQSWFWIIGIGMFGAIIGHAIAQIGASDK